MDRLARFRYQLVTAPLLFLLYVEPGQVHHGAARLPPLVSPPPTSQLPHSSGCYFLVAGNLLVSLWNTIVYDPQSVEVFMLWFIPRFPDFSHWMPLVTPEKLLNHSEVMAIHHKDASLVKENKDWKVEPWARNYLSFERRHQTGRRMTRAYLRLRMKDVRKKTCINIVVQERIDRFPGSDPCRAQWRRYLRQWEKEMVAADNWTFGLRRTKPEDETDHISRVKNGWMFSWHSLREENEAWERYRFLYEAMGAVPLEDELVIIQFDRLFSWIWIYKYLDSTARQVRHWCQFEVAEEKWREMQKTMRADGFDTLEEARTILPELFAEYEGPDGEVPVIAPNIVKMPEAKRYMKADFYNRLLFQSQKVMEQMNELERQGKVQAKVDNQKTFFFGKTEIGPHPLAWLYYNKIWGCEMEEDIPPVYENLVEEAQFDAAMKKLEQDFARQEMRPQIVKEDGELPEDEEIPFDYELTTANDIVFENAEVRRPRRVPPLVLEQQIPSNVYRY